MQAAEAARFDLFAKGVDLGLEEFGIGELRVGKLRLLALDGLVDGQAMERLREVEFAALVDEDFLAQCLAAAWRSRPSVKSISVL